MRRSGALLRLIKGGWGPALIAALLLSARYSGATTLAPDLDVLVLFALSVLVAILLLAGRLGTVLATVWGVLAGAACAAALRAGDGLGSIHSAFWGAIPLTWVVLQLWIFVHWYSLHTNIPRAFPSAKYLPTLIGLSLATLFGFNLFARWLAGQSLAEISFSILALGNSEVVAGFDQFISTYPSLKFELYALLLLVSAVVATGAGETRLSAKRASWARRRASELAAFRRDVLRANALDHEDAEIQSRVQHEFMKTVYGLITVSFSFWLVVREIPTLIIAALFDVAIMLRTNSMAALLMLIEAIMSAPAAAACGVFLLFGMGALLGHVFGLDPSLGLPETVAGTFGVTIGALLYLTVIAEFRQIQTTAMSAGTSEGPPRDGDGDGPVYALRFFGLIFTIVPAAILLTAAVSHIMSTIGIVPSSGQLRILTPTLTLGVWIVVGGLTLALLLGAAGVMLGARAGGGGAGPAVAAAGAGRAVGRLAGWVMAASRFVGQRLAEIRQSAGRASGE